jgi:peptide/nickel transport system substrate-binding protein
MSIVSERAVRELGDKYAQNPVGTGPMKFVNWVVGNRIELTRWDQYWGPAPKIKNLTIRYISDDATRLLELETGGVDMMLNVPPQEVERVEANPNLKLYRAPSLSLNFIGFNTQKPPLNDERVRRAITHAIDMEALVKTVYMGVGKPGRGPIGSMVWASAADILPQLEYNPALAKELLAEAGYPDGFTITLSTNDSAQRVDSAIIVQSMLAAVGIKVEISIVEWAAYLEMLDSGKQDMYILGWVTVTGDPDYGLEVFHSRSFGPGGNYAFYEDPEVDRLLDAARGETDMDLRRQLYIEAQQIIHAAAPWIYTLEGEVLIAARSNVEGFQIDPAQHHPYWTVWFNDK